MHLNQSSSFLSGHEEAGGVSNPQFHITPPGFSKEELQLAYIRQREKNEKNVVECKQLLEKLKEF